MTVDLHGCITDVRDGLADVPVDMLDDKMIYNALNDAYDYILEIADPEAKERTLRRCTIRYATFISYQMYTALAEKRLGSIPQSASLQLQTLLMQTYNCLSLISMYELNPDLSVDNTHNHSPVCGSLSPSIL